MLMGMQSIDYRSMMISNLPAEDSTDPWDSDGPVLTTFVIVTEPGEHDVDVIGDVQEKVTEWAEELAENAKSETGDSDSWHGIWDAESGIRDPIVWDPGSRSLYPLDRWSLQPLDI